MVKREQSLRVPRAQERDEYLLKFDVDPHIGQARLSNIPNQHSPLHLVYQSH